MFPILTRPHFPKHAVGFERDCITALSLSKEGRHEFTISAATTMDLTENVLIPNFDEVNIRNRTEVRKSLREITEAAGLHEVKNWSVSLPSASARTAIIVLENPPTSNAEREQILEWKSERVFGSAASSLRITFEKLSPDEKGAERFWAAAVSLNVLDEFESLFAELDWRAGLILPRAVSELKWLQNGKAKNDSLLVSEQPGGFTAYILRDNVPSVIRTVSCSQNEFADEFFRLLMFYKDRVGARAGSNSLERLLFLGEDSQKSRIGKIAEEALGKSIRVLGSEDVGLRIPSSSLRFGEVAAPAGLASMAWA